MIIRKHLKGGRIALFFLFLVLFMKFAGAVQRTPKDLSLQEKIYILSKTYSSINLYFSHWQAIPDYSIDSSYKACLKKIMGTKDRFSFDMLMMEFLGQLRNGHTWYFDRWLLKEFGQPLGFKFKYIHGKWIITKSFISPLKRGEIIDKINGKSFEEFYQKMRKYINASSDRERRVKFKFKTFLFPEKFTLKLLSGKKVVINRKVQNILRKERKTEGRWIENGSIAYIKIPGFDNPTFEKSAIEYVKKYRKAKVLIVDIRDNGGGNTPGELIDILQDRPYRFWTESTQVSFSLFRAYKKIIGLFGNQLSKDYKNSLEMFSDYFGDSHLLWFSHYKKPENTIFKGKLIILSDRGCASACEDFVVTFKDNHRAMIVGERTMGSSGQPYMYKFNDDIFIAIGTKREYMPDGSPFEGKGIEPDIKILPELKDIKNGKDPVLEKAIAIAKRDKIF